MSADPDRGQTTRTLLRRLTNDGGPDVPVRTSTRRPKVFVFGGAESDDSAELQTLLRQRLRLIAIFVTVASVLASVQKSVSFDPNAHVGFLRWAWSWPDLRQSLVNIVVYAVVAGILFRRELPSLRILRLIELLIFGEGLVTICVSHWYVLHTGGWLADLLARGHLNILATAQSLSWFLIIVAYGTLIPNTGRRCAGVVGTFALMGLALAAVSLARNGVSGPDTFRYLLQMGIYEMLAVGIAIIGSHRLEVLRLAASEARRLGQYQLKERLGAGGMGEVYLAEHLLLRRPCAVKLIRPECAGDPWHLRRFEREVRTTATLSHPNTVQIFDYGHADDGTFYYAMEYLPGLTLEQLVERHGPLPPARAIHFLRQLCGSLREAHSVGLIHRDIKPGNVMVCVRGGVHDVAKLLDFGLVRPGHTDGDNATMTQEGMVTGTPAYMSPEQAGGQRDLDARSDLYSLGGVAYFLLAGRAPFAGRSAVRMMAAHLYEEPAPFSQFRDDVPSELELAVFRCLAKAPSSRFADVEAFDTALANCHVAEDWSGHDAARWWREQGGAT